MRIISSLLTILFISVATIFVASARSSEVSLSRVAASSQLLLNWLGPQRAVSLTAPGLVIVVRPGQDVIEVNDRIEVVSQAPTYRNGDLYVTSQLASHIATLARDAARRASLQAAAPSLAAGGHTIYGSLTLTAKNSPGVDAVLVNGTAPSGAPVVITLLANIGEDIPTVVLSRHDLVADDQGRFQAIIPTGPDYLAGSTIRVLATSVPTVKEASVLITVPTTHQ